MKRSKHRVSQQKAHAFCPVSHTLFARMIKVVALFHFHDIEDVDALKDHLESLTDQHGIQGMLILATEGINGTIAAEEAIMDVFLTTFLSDPRFVGAEIKFSSAETQPFYRMRISIRKEIVTMGVQDFKRRDCPEVVMVNPHEWNEILKQEDVIIVDTRNDYEVKLGTFQNAVDPKTSNFREFPAFVANQLTDKSKPVAMFCTGGIRCEKAASYLAQQGFSRVYNLKGGILKYLEEVGEDESLWQGECFVFDQRVSVTHGLKQGHCELCRGCRQPLMPEETQDEHFKRGVHCRYVFIIV
ncbi:rhodanese-related sulfurtransferase [archaeon]|nr:MAG: rhodanese-related sulfurtransferase [archaeon]